MNLPNKLTVARIILCPFFMIFLVYPFPNVTWARILAAALFSLAAVTDAIDGHLARKNGQVTNFGKFFDPLADKILVIGAYVCLCAGNLNLSVLMKNVLLWATIIVIFRELAVTSLRLLLSKESGLVVAANMLGKLKTVSQCVCVLVILLEPIIFSEQIAIFHTYNLLSYICIAIMVTLTIISGYNYIKTYWGYLDPTV